MQKNIVTFGEIMLRLAPNNHEKILQAESFRGAYGGAEANVAVSLAMLGNMVSFVTRLPRNALGDAAVNALRRFGVNTNYIIRGGERIGIYFIEHGASIRPSKVIYDRSRSAISAIEKGMINWHAVFRGKDWFHFTGITPALSSSAADVCLEAVKAAKDEGLKVSCDLNYRKKLWSKEKAGSVMSGLVKYVDVLISNEEDASEVFGIKAGKSDITAGKLDIGSYESVADQLLNICGAETVAVTLRESKSASDNDWSAVLYDGSNFFRSKKYSIHLVDRVGGGDSFCAGLIHGLIREQGSREVLEFAAAASALKQTIPGDFNLSSENEIINTVQGDTSGRVQR